MEERLKVTLFRVADTRANVKNFRDFLAKKGSGEAELKFLEECEEYKRVGSVSKKKESGLYIYSRDTSAR
jgi:hypothetical protein